MDIREQIKQNMRILCLNMTTDVPSGEVYCPVDFDDWTLCWNATPPATIAKHPCPKDPNSFAYRECWPNGTWFVHPKSKSGKPWTNYTACVNLDDLSENINNFYIIGYSVSLVTLIISLIIFFVFRSLKCTRIRMHIHLFVSLALNNISWIIWYKEVSSKADDGRVLNNPVWCQALALVKTYFMLTNYMWMFCEALNLHLSLVVVFVRDEVAMKWFIAIGWVFPLIITFVYAMVRIFALEDTILCWMYDNQAEYILTIPVFISLIISFIFLVNVLRVILNAMHPRLADPATVGIRRAARAAGILIPLFGLHFCLFPFRPQSGSPYEIVYDYALAISISLQGLCVSCLFCFANHDVHQAIRVFIHRQMHTSRWSNYYYTGAVDSAGVYVINSQTNSHTNNLALI